MWSYQAAFGRALSWWCQDGGGVIEALINRVAFEAHQIISSEVKVLALLLKRRGVPLFVSEIEGVALPATELLGSLLVDYERAGGGCRVRDHALDPVRFIASRFRTSIMVSVDGAEGLIPECKSVLWFGLHRGVSNDLLAQAQEMARALSEWFEAYRGVILAHVAMIERDKTNQQRSHELVGILHDARAPLGALRYIASESIAQDHTEQWAREIDYLEQLLSKGGPTNRASQHQRAEVNSILSRVVARFKAQEWGERITVCRSYEDVGVAISPLDLERVVTNLVSNALQHSPGCRVSLSAEVRGDRSVITVRDDGSGISPEVLAAIQEDRQLNDAGNGGWGMGLRTCQRLICSYGGSLSIASQQDGSSTQHGRGTVIEVSLPSAPICTARPSPSVCDGAVHAVTGDRIDVILIDDDQEHSSSLRRLLGRHGIKASHCESVEGFLASNSASADQIVICDAQMPDGGAERLLSLVSDRSQMSRIAVMSGDVDDQYLYKISALGAQAFFSKPVDLSELCGWIRTVKGAA